MSTQELSEIHVKYNTYPPEVQKVIALLATAMLGSHKELQTKGYYSEGENPGELWEWLNSFCENLVNERPGIAFETAIALLECPGDLKSAENPEKFRYWMQGTGLAILSLPEIESLLIPAVNNDSTLFDNLKQALEFNTKGWDQDQCMKEPRSYNRFAAVAVGVNLRNSQPGTRSHELFQMANTLRRNPRYEQQIRDYYWVIPDCQGTVRLIYTDQPKEWMK